MGSVAAVATATKVGLDVLDAHEQHKAGKKADKAQRAELARQQQAIDEQNKQALSERKQKIDQMRMQMAGRGTGTRGTSSSGVKARIGGGMGDNTLG